MKLLILLREQAVGDLVVYIFNKAKTKTKHAGLFLSVELGVVSKAIRDISGRKGHE